MYPGGAENNFKNMIRIMAAKAEGLKDPNLIKIDNIKPIAFNVEFTVMHKRYKRLDWRDGVICI